MDKTNRKQLFANISKTQIMNITTKQTSTHLINAMFTLYRIGKRSVAGSLPDRASVHTRNAPFEAVSAPEQYCSALLRC